MSETTTEAVVETSDDTTTAAATGATTTETAAVADGEKALGDAGKKALDAMKAERNEARTAAKELEAKFAALEAKVAGKEAEFTAAQEAQRIKDEALSAANQRILKAEVRAAAASKLADPQDALRFLDLSEFEVGSDGEVDASQVAKAIDDLIRTKPYLAAQGGQRFQGSADGGARNDAAKVSQLSQADMSRMTPEQIAEAHDKGQFDDLIRGA
jgi:hypothetical protein